MKLIRVMGIDPGIAITGYSLLEEKSGDYILLGSGLIRTAKEIKPAQRLKELHEAICSLIGRYNPQAMAVEKIFFSKNVRTAFQVGEARGVIVLAAAQQGIDLFEYTPLQVKQSVAGYGKADKLQVQKMVQLLLRLKEAPLVDDEADAIAVALCYLQARRFNDAVGGDRKR